MDLCTGALLSSLPQGLSSSLLVMWTRFFLPCSLQGFPRSVSPNPPAAQRPSSREALPLPCPQLAERRPGAPGTQRGPQERSYLVRVGLLLTTFPSALSTLKELGKETVPGLWARRRARRKGPKRKRQSPLGPRNLLQDFVLGLQAHPLPHGSCSPS